jgi:3-isopropylmalate/(R)-2-methylmalate dehydratase large subunit
MTETLYDKLWRTHVVHEDDDGTALLYIDRHLVHEVSSPQAFEGLRQAGRDMRRPAAALAVVDHNVPTIHRDHVRDPISREQIETLERNCHDFSLNLYRLSDMRQGIVHIIGPEQGLTLPGMTLVCGDSHTSTNGALGTLAFGIGTTDIEHVMATQCIKMRKAKNMRVRVEGSLGQGVSAKDIILAVIGKIGTDGGNGCAIEYAGSTIRNLSIEARMTICNMSIEAGARCGMVAVDDTTIDYVRGRPYAPEGDLWRDAVVSWRELHSDPDAVFDKDVEVDAGAIEPQVTWGTTPGMVVPVGGTVPDPAGESRPNRRLMIEKALEYMALKPGTPMTEIALDKVFIGSCTNARIEDLRAAAKVVRGQKVAANIKQALVVPGSGLVKQQAEKEGLDRIFTDAGFEWRGAGCSMSLGMNPDRLSEGERCASTSNRNFEGRQGHGGRSHLASPVMVAAAAIHGHFVYSRELGISDSSI